MKSQQQHQEQIILVLQQHYSSTQLSVKSLAEMLDVSERYLLDICIAHFGKTPAKLILSYRIKKALELQERIGAKNFTCTMVGYGNYRTYKRALQEYHTQP